MTAVIHEGDVCDTSRSLCVAHLASLSGRICRGRTGGGYRRISMAEDGRYTKSIENFKLAVPHRLTSTGDFQSFHLPQFFRHNPNKKRKKRSSADSDMVHYGITVNNQNHHVELWPNHDFLSPNLVFESRDPNLKVQDRKLRTLVDKELCHYTGNVRGSENSRAALSACDGLAGYITVDNVRYFIEPVEEHGPNEEGHHLHVVYETQPGYEHYKTKNRCGTTESWEEAWKRRFREKLARGERLEKRGSTSLHRYMEILVVSDKKFLNHHKNRDVETYIMTVMNMARLEKPSKLAFFSTPPSSLSSPWSSTCGNKLHTQNPEKFNAWAELIRDHVIGPFFIDGDLNGDQYLAPPHYRITVWQYIELTFPNQGVLAISPSLSLKQVADFYHDASSGNQMDFVIVRMMYLEKEEEEIDLIINNDADKTLASFCKWQMKVNPQDIENPNHHDIAVLLTRYDICADAGADCGLMGLAYVAAACTKDEPCALNEDGGLQLGIVVAHEVGHVYVFEIPLCFKHNLMFEVVKSASDIERMGCSHDKEGESSCAAQDKDESFFVMAPYVHLFTTKWSTCSRGFITALFENGLGDCLNDEPQTSLYQYKNALPGTVYDALAQCELNYPGSTVCLMNQDKFCESLLCQTSPASCMGNEEPPADGTKCGENKWCYRKQCVEIGSRPEAINGGWGEWGSWSGCSRTCGGGVSISERDCNNPVPEHKGRYCLGERKKVRICNVEPCPLGTPNYREVQCEEQSKEPFNGMMYHWKAHFKDDEPCCLYCTNEVNQLAKLQPRVKDGTPCKPGTKDMCISGVCRKIGCDNQVDSDAVEDVCGICNGDGTQCKIVEEVYKDTGARDYKKVATIPAGSRNLLIDELGPSMNTIAISDKTEKNFYLNGDHKEELDGEKKFGGEVEGVYSHPEPGKESLVIHGPLTDDLIFF
ncbi:hypothetical protein NQ317_016646, partial [Molorchus minor]